MSWVDEDTLYSCANISSQSHPCSLSVVRFIVVSCWSFANSYIQVASPGILVSHLARRGTYLFHGVVVACLAQEGSAFSLLWCLHAV